MSLFAILWNAADLVLSTIIFVAIFVTFLTQCVDYSKIPKSTTLSQVVYPQCTKKISGMPNVAIWLFTLWVFGQIWLFVVDIPRLMRLHDFFLYLLEVPDSDIQTVSWQEIVARLMALRDQNPITVEKITPANRKYIGTQSKQRLDAHDIANRLMRRENYFIALFNKEILDLTLPLPFLQGRQLFSRTLYWNLNWCIMDFIFNQQNQVNQLVLKDSHRRQLSEGLRNRFLFAAFMNIIFAPLIVMYLLTVYFLKYFNASNSAPRPYCLLICIRSIKRILPLWGHDNTLRLPNGSFGNLTRYITSMRNEQTCRTRSLRDISNSFLRERWENLPDSWDSWLDP